MNVCGPAVRVRMSCACSAPSAVGADGLLDARLDLRRGGLVHERAHGFDRQPVADAQNVERHGARDQRIEDRPSRHRRQHEAGEHADRGDDVADEVVAIALQRR